MPPLLTLKKDPRHTLHAHLTRHTRAFPPLLLTLLICTTLAFWTAFLIAYTRGDGVDTWVNLCVVAALLTVASVVQALYCVWVRREERVRVKREEQLDMAREEGRREGFAAAAGADAAA
ncbi:hypothetical protein IWX49DRAFT_76149 [Phyllosticta citricarpa]